MVHQCEVCLVGERFHIEEPQIGGLRLGRFTQHVVDAGEIKVGGDKVGPGIDGPAQGFLGTGEIPFSHASPGYGVVDDAVVRLSQQASQYRLRPLVVTCYDLEVGEVDLDLEILGILLGQFLGVLYRLLPVAAPGMYPDPHLQGLLGEGAFVDDLLQGCQGRDVVLEDIVDASLGKPGIRGVDP